MNTLRSIACVAVAACGATPDAPMFHPRRVDPLFVAPFLALASEVNGALGYDCLEIDEVGGVGEIVANNRAVHEAGQLIGKPVAASADVVTRTILMRETDPKIWTLAPMRLAHEVGHMLGLEHASSGLMMPAGDAACERREAACLLDALRAGGAL
jgi:hypothetical protein